MRFGSNYQPRKDEDWIFWKEKYERWMALPLLDRSSLARDRVTPIFRSLWINRRPAQNNPWQIRTGMQGCNKIIGNRNGR